MQATGHVQLPIQFPVPVLVIVTDQAGKVLSCEWRDYDDAVALYEGARQLQETQNSQEE